MALKSVAEGDATIAGFAYVAGRMDNSIADTLVSSLNNLPETFAAQSKDTPDGLGYPLIFQYSGGARFVSEAYKRGGWKAVDALYSKPPQSTQQIIDPSLYFDRPLLPVEVELHGYQPILKEWTVADEDTFGELSIQLILQLGYGKDAPEVAVAKRWAGDRMVVLSHGSDVAVIWIAVFRDDDAARRFEETYRTMLDRIRASTPHQMERRGNSVVVIAGSIASQSSSLEPAVWKASKIGRMNPPAGPAPILKTDAKGNVGASSPHP